MLTDILSKEGLERVDQAGVAFDPAVHDAVAHAEAEPGQEGAVVEEVLRAGYRWKGQDLRAAMVRVRG
jgi:molecular chaperone GrpE